MNFLAEKQKTNLLYNSGSDIINLDCFVAKFDSNTIRLKLNQNQKNDFNDFIEDDEVNVKIYTPKGILVFKSEILNIISETELIISFDENNTKLENIRQNPRYKTDCPMTIFRALQGNIDAKVIDISLGGLRFYSDVPLDANSEFEIILYLSDTIGKVMLTGQVLDKTGLPEGIHRMLIKEISYPDKQKLVNYCLTLAE